MQETQNSLVFVFPGQGSQAVGMLADLAAGAQEVRRVFARASDALGFDLWHLVQEGPESELNQTLNTQPAMLAAGYAVWETWCARSCLRPGWMAGHSLGEYTALVCAGALDFEDAVRLVRARARFMQEAVPPGVGAMAALLGLDDAVVETVCAEASNADEQARPANFNSPGQIVIAGHAGAVGRAMNLAKAAGAKRALPLPVSVPSHCALMMSAVEAMEIELAHTAIRAPDTRVVHNADATCHSDPEAIRHILARQLSEPVRWIESVRHMHAAGAHRFLELGPGKVLAGLNKRIVAECVSLPVHDTKSLHEALESLA